MNEKGYKLIRDVEEVELYIIDESDGEVEKIIKKGFVKKVFVKSNIEIKIKIDVNDSKKE